MTTTTEPWPTIDDASAEQVGFHRQMGCLQLGPIFSRQEMDTHRQHVDQMIESLSGAKRPEETDVPHFDDPFPS